MRRVFGKLFSCSKKQITSNVKKPAGWLAFSGNQMITWLVQQVQQVRQQERRQQEQQVRRQQERRQQVQQARRQQEQRQQERQVQRSQQLVLLLALLSCRNQPKR
ncbi:MAG: hypothetical protein Q8Q81_18520 [Oxalobacteraceae bacterium]|nr:hypothetical protein [Oxalobacteraceae bacterium]